MKLYQKYLIAILALLLVVILFFYNKQEDQFITRISNVITNLLRTQLDHEKTQTMAFALALAQNDTLKHAVLDDNSEMGFKIIQQYMKTLQSFRTHKVRTQIVSEDFIIFARSWDNSVAGLPIEESRPDLLIQSKTQKPKVSYEAARRMVLIATVPIIHEVKVIAFVEVIEMFQHLEEFFKPFDMDFIALLDDRYQHQSVLLGDYPRIDNMIVANDNANIHHISVLKEAGLSELLEKRIYKGDTHIYFSNDVSDSEGDIIGHFVLALPKKKLALFDAFEEELEPIFTYARRDLYFTVRDKIVPEGLYKDVDDKSLLESKNIVHDEDRELILQRLEKRLQTYTKDELISLLLQVDTGSKIEGEIQ